MNDKVRVSGQVVWVGKKDWKGKPYWRVGILPDDEENALFFNVYTVDPPGEKGANVSFEVTVDAMKKARTQRVTETQGTDGQPKSEKPVKSTEERITKAVALKAAADAICAIVHTDISALSRNVTKLASDFENWLTEGVPF